MVMDKRDRAIILADRLASALGRSQTSASALGRRIGIDRSTIGQLLDGKQARLPNGHVLAALAEGLGVSADWLLGLVDEPGGAAEILEASVQITRSARAPFDEAVMGWFHEAEGRKIRHVPTGLPDLLKTNEVLRFEWAEAVGKTPRQAAGIARDTLDYVRLPEVDMEMAMSQQALASFAVGGALWEGLAPEVRRAQLERMADLLEELYPGLRLYLFDERRAWSAPFTVFGGLRAALYIGGAFFVFTNRAHVRALAARFDTLVRDSFLQAHDVPQWLRERARTIDG